jgi:hypothetical protein
MHGRAALAAAATSAPPKLVESHLLRDGNTVTGLVMTFSKPLDPATAQDVGNYTLIPSGPAEGNGAVTAAVYDAANDSVTLVLAQAVTIPPARGLAAHSFDFTVEGPTSASTAAANYSMALSRIAYPSVHSASPSGATASGTATVSTSPSGATASGTATTSTSPSGATASGTARTSVPMELASQGRRLDASLPVTGITDTSGQLLDSTGDGNPDGRLFAQFRARGSTPNELTVAYGKTQATKLAARLKREVNHQSVFTQIRNSRYDPLFPFIGSW